MTDLINRLRALFGHKEAAESPPEKEPDARPAAKQEAEAPRWPAYDRQHAPPTAPPAERPSEAPHWPASDRQPAPIAPAPTPTSEAPTAPQAPLPPGEQQQAAARPPSPTQPPVQEQMPAQEHMPSQAPPEPLAQAQAPLAAPRPLDDESIQRRKRRAAESILENEALTADLDDRSAGRLNAWGLRCAEQAAQHTAGMNDETAETVLDDELRATRKMLRAVNQWVASQQQGDSQASETSLARVIEQASVLYGSEFAPPTPEERRALQQQAAALARDPAALVDHLRSRIEKRGPGRPTSRETR